MTETQIKELTVENPQVKALYSNLLQKQQTHWQELQVEVEGLKKARETSDDKGE